MNPPKSSDALNRALGHLEKLDANKLTILIQRLRRERELLESITNAIDEGVLLLDQQARVQYANRAATELLQLPSEEAPLQLKRVIPELAEALSSASGSLPIDASRSLQLKVAYPQARYLHIHYTPIRPPAAASEAEARILILLTDITNQVCEHKDKIKQLQSSGLIELTAELAHEIGNPLSAVQIHLQLLQRKLKGNAAFEASLNTCSKELRRLNHILQHFLKAARPQTPSLESVQLNSLIQESLRTLEGLLEDRRIKIHCKLKAELPTALADPNQIQQVIYNIIKNAIEAMSDGGTLSIHTKTHARHISIHFTDEGRGIPSKDLPHVFEPHFSGKSDGNGLGLIITQRIIAEHNGELDIQNHPKGGTSVNIRLQREHPEHPQLSAKSEASDA